MLSVRIRWYLRDRHDVKGIQDLPDHLCERGLSSGVNTAMVVMERLGGSSLPTITGTDQVVQNSDAQSENLNLPESRDNRIICDEGSSGLVWGG